MPKFYITTAIAYVNSSPHVGFAMEVIQADVLARYYRAQLGDKNVFFLTGTDEHGSKIVQTAKQQGSETEYLVDKNAALFLELAEKLHISNDFFIRTSSAEHRSGAQKMWHKLVQSGDVYKSTYTGWYCVGCEAFVTETDLVDGKCTLHMKEPDRLSEDNYFFRLSKYSQKIADLIETDTLRIVPQSRRTEILNMARKGFTDVSFSRPKAVLSWGVSVPDDPEHVMYVWCDALSNYITALDYEHDGELFKRFWPADVHLIGKDILRFHAGVWIGMLLSAGLVLPKAIYVHGFITSEGQKMSKSLGNVVDPFEMVNKYGVDALRYYLLREIPTTDDGDFSQRRFYELYQSDLANNLGNLLSRVVSMTEKYFEGKIQVSGDPQSYFPPYAVDKWRCIHDEYIRSINDFDLKKALEVVMDFATFANQYIENTKPWKLAKDNTKELEKVLVCLLEMLRMLIELLSPFLPETARRMAEQMQFSSSGFKVKKGEALFPKLEEKK